MKGVQDEMNKPGETAHTVTPKAAETPADTILKQ